MKNESGATIVERREALYRIEHVASKTVALEYGINTWDAINRLCQKTGWEIGVNINNGFIVEPA